MTTVDSGLTKNGGNGNSRACSSIGRILSSTQVLSCRSAVNASDDRSRLFLSRHSVILDYSNQTVCICVGAETIHMRAGPQNIIQLLAILSTQLLNQKVTQLKSVHCCSLGRVRNLTSHLHSRIDRCHTKIQASVFNSSWFNKQDIPYH